MQQQDGIKFAQTYDGKRTTVEIDRDASLPQVIEAFLDFMRAAGYSADREKIVAAIAAMEG